MSTIRYHYHLKINRLLNVIYKGLQKGLTALKLGLAEKTTTLKAGACRKTDSVKPDFNCRDMQQNANSESWLTQ